MSDWKNVQYKDGKMRTSEGGGGGGSSTFAGLDDVSFNNVQNGQVPKYNSTTQKWENANESGGGSEHTYSETEQVIGIWIDGKPLYEKTYLVTSPSSTSTENLVNLASLSVKHMIRIDATIFQTNNDATDSTNFFKVWYSSNNGNIRCLIMESAYCNMDMAVTIQYTKTTD